MCIMIYNEENLCKCIATIENRFDEQCHFQCQICSAIPENPYRLDVDNSDDPPSPSWVSEIDQLQRVSGLEARSFSINQCPDCGQCYGYSSIYTYYMGCSETEYTLVKLKKGEGLAWMQERLSYYVLPTSIRQTNLGFEISYA